MSIEKALIFDTETTGKKDPVLIEAAGALCLLDESGVYTGSHFVQRFNPGRPITNGAMATRGITDEELVNCPPAEGFRLLPGITYLIGHNIDFDWEVIGKPDIKRICTLAMSRKLWPDIDHSLSAMMWALDRQNAKQLTANAHSALADIAMCVKLLEHIMALTGIFNLGELYNFSEESRIPTKFTFGKHADKTFQEVAAADRGYLDWCLKQPDFDPYVQMAIRRAMGLLPV